MGAPAESLILGDGGVVVNRQTGEESSFSKIACFTLYSHDQFQIQAGASYTGGESPAPFMAHFAEVDVDLETGKVRLVKFVSAGDCGRPINPVLTEGQIEGPP